MLIEHKQKEQERSYGTFPMMLGALDERVDFRLFTTVPFLNEVYEGKVYTNAYEKNRMFETLHSQDKKFIFQGYEDLKFWVAESEDPEMEERAIAEIAAMIEEKRL